MYTLFHQEKKDMEELKAQLSALALQVHELATAQATTTAEVSRMAQITQATQMAQAAQAAQVNQEPTNVVEEYQDVAVTVSVPKDVYKTLPEFNGDRNQYRNWFIEKLPNVDEIF